MPPAHVIAKFTTPCHFCYQQIIPGVSIYHVQYEDETCHWMHLECAGEWAEATGCLLLRPVCKHWSRRGYCLFGDTCFYRHPQELGLEQPPRPAPRRVPVARRSAAGAVSGYARRPKVKNRFRASVLRRWLLDVYGPELLRRGSGVLDVAGGKGELSFEMCNLHAIPSTVIDPRPLALRKCFRQFQVGMYHRNALFSEYLPMTLEEAQACGAPQPPRHARMLLDASLLQALRHLLAALGLLPQQSFAAVTDELAAPRAAGLVGGGEQLQLAAELPQHQAPPQCTGTPAGCQIHGKASMRTAAPSEEALDSCAATSVPSSAGAGLQEAVANADGLDNQLLLWLVEYAARRRVQQAEPGQNPLLSCRSARAGDGGVGLGVGAPVAGQLPTVDGAEVEARLLLCPERRKALEHAAEEVLRSISASLRQGRQVCWTRKGLTHEDGGQLEDEDGDGEEGEGGIEDAWLEPGVVAEQQSLCERGQREHDAANSLKDAGEILRLLLSCSCCVGMHPDQAAEPILDLALLLGVPFAVVPCCVYASQFPGRVFRNGGAVTSCDDLLRYLQEKASAHHRNVRVERMPFEGRNWIVYCDTGRRRAANRSSDAQGTFPVTC